MAVCEAALPAVAYFASVLAHSFSQDHSTTRPCLRSTTDSQQRERQLPRVDALEISNYLATLKNLPEQKAFLQKSKTPALFPVETEAIFVKRED